MFKTNFSGHEKIWRVQNFGAALPRLRVCSWTIFILARLWKVTIGASFHSQSKASVKTPAQLLDTLLSHFYLTVEQPRKKRRRSSAAATCCYYSNHDGMSRLTKSILDKVLDIEDVVREGKSVEACPYYATRLGFDEQWFVECLFDKHFRLKICYISCSSFNLRQQGMRSLNFSHA